MTISSRLARPMLASIFVTGGLDALRYPEGKVKAAEAVARPLGRWVSGLPADAATLVRLNGAVQVGAGALLATGKLRRIAALVLAGSIIPTTYAGHRFWEETDEAERSQQQMHFLKNLGLLGGLLLAAADTEGAPSLGWRAKRQADRIGGALADGRASTGAKIHRSVARVHDTAASIHDTAAIANEPAARVRDATVRGYKAAAMANDRLQDGAFRANDKVHDAATRVHDTAAKVHDEAHDRAHEVSAKAHDAATKAHGTASKVHDEAHDRVHAVSAKAHDAAAKAHDVAAKVHDEAHVKANEATAKAMATAQDTAAKARGTAARAHKSATSASAAGRRGARRAARRADAAARKANRVVEHAGKVGADAVESYVTARIERAGDLLGAAQERLSSS